MTWMVNKNMPGYLPESEPTEVDTFEEALEAISEEVNRDLDAAFESVPDDADPAQLKYIGDEDTKFTEMLEAARERDTEPTGISFQVHNLVYFAERTLS